MRNIFPGLCILLLTATSLTGCKDTPQKAQGGVEKILSDVARIHGAAGPFAVSGYRMAQRALREFGVKRGDWSLQVIHHTPQRVQWSCIADGLQAATGTSAGKLSLRLKLASIAETHSVIRHKKQKEELVFRLKSSFVKRYLNTPRKQLRGAAREVAGLADEKIFTLTRRLRKKA